MRQPLVLLIAAIVLVHGCSTKRTAIDTSLPQDPRWAPIDSLAVNGQYASALPMTNALLAEARANGDWQLEFRAMMTAARFQQETGVEDPVIISAFETRAGSAAFPLNALLHSVIGEQYWSYYRDNRWEIMERTATQDDPADMSTWSQPVFMRKVIEEYRASLVDVDSLKVIPVGTLAPLLAHADIVYSNRRAS